MRHDLLADVFSAIKNAEKVGKREVTIQSSSTIKNILEILKKKGYIEGYEVTMKNNYQEFVVKLKSKINELKVVKPRLSFKKHELGIMQSRFLPGDNVGFLLISTPKNQIITDREIKDEGGIILGYVY